MKDDNTKDLHDSTAVTQSQRTEFSVSHREYALAYLQERSDRGRLGAIQRGGMLSRVAFGYTLAKPTLKGYGAQWTIVEDKASTVREIFEKRAAGLKLSAIAYDLNRRGVEPPHGRRIDCKGQWRASTVRQILTNKIYRGVYTFFSINRPGSRGTDLIKGYFDYPRPELRLVTDELWFAANPTAKD